MRPPAAANPISAAAAIITGAEGTSSPPRLTSPTKAKAMNGARRPTIRRPSAMIMNEAGSWPVLSAVSPASTSPGRPIACR